MENGTRDGLVFSGTISHVISAREGEDNGLFITLVPKVLQ